jgi:hypothetical protein
MKPVFLSLVIGLIFMAGCVTYPIKDANGVVVATRTSLDPNNAAVKAVEPVLQAGQAVSTGLSVVWPVGTLIAGIFGATLAAWRKYKPLLTIAQTKADQAYNATSAVVTAIEKYKTDNPANWAALQAELEKAVGPTAENIIRAIRGLPAKT